MPTVTSENKAQFDQDFLNKKNGVKQTCPNCGAQRSDIKVLSEAEMIEKNKSKLKNHPQGDLYSSFKNDKGVTQTSKQETLTDLTEGNESFCGVTKDHKYVYHRQPVPSYRRKK